MKLPNDKSGGNMGPVALILAGYNRVDHATRREYEREIKESYDGEELYMGKNKFLYSVKGRPIISYVLDAVYGARKNGKRIYEKVYVYNDIKSFTKTVDVSAYDNLEIRQMTESVAGHMKDFYPLVEYGQRVDIYFGDTPRITSEDVEYIFDSYTDIFANESDYRGVPVRMIYGVVHYDDMRKDNWLPHRIKFFKRGQKKGKLKSFVNFTDGPVRIGNSASFIKHMSIDGLVARQSLNLLYNLRKALTPSSISKIMYYLIKLKKYRLVGQIRRKSIVFTELYQTFLDILSRLYKLDLSDYSGVFFRIKKNAGRWENDIDGPQDLVEFKKRL